MQLDAEQFEAIVREVMRRLGVAAAAPAASAGAAQGGTASANGAARELSLTERVVTTHHLEGKLAGVARLRVAARAILTPAARDLLKEHRIEITQAK